MNEQLIELARALRSALLGHAMRKEDMVMPWNGWLALSAVRYQVGRGDAPLDPDQFAAHVERRRKESAVEARLWRWMPTVPLIAWSIVDFCDPTQGNAPARLFAPLASLVDAAQRADPDRKTRLLENFSRRFSDIEVFAPDDVRALQIITKYHRKWLATFAAAGIRQVIRALPSAFDGAELTHLCDTAAMASRSPESLIDVVEALQAHANAPVSEVTRIALPLLDPGAPFDHYLFDCIAHYLIARQVDIDLVIAKLRDIATVDRLSDGSEPPALVGTAGYALTYARDAAKPMVRRGLRSQDARVQADFVELCSAPVIAEANVWVQAEIDAIIQEQPDRATSIRAAIARGRSLVRRSRSS